MDSRDQPTWIAIELSRLGEQKIEELEIESIIRSDLGVDDDFPIFVPAAIFNKQEKTIIIHLMEGYIFVKAGLSESSYFALEDQPYVNNVMSTTSGPHNIRTLAVLPNKEIESLKKKLRQMISSEIEIGANVNVLEGKFKKLEGTVVGISEKGEAYVHFKTRSWEKLTSIPRVFLDQISPPG